MSAFLIFETVDPFSHRSRVCENRVLRRIFGPKRDEVTGQWRKLHGGELHNLYTLPGIDGRMGSEWPLGRFAVGGGAEWIHVAQDRDRWRAVVNAVMNLRVLASRS
jgi:hypothetical protein